MKKESKKEAKAEAASTQAPAGNTASLYKQSEFRTVSYRTYVSRPVVVYHTR